MGAIVGCCVRTSSKKTKIIYSKSISDKSYSMLKFKSTITKEDIHALYNLGITLGKGFFSKVILANKKSDPQQNFAVKIIEKQEMDPTLHEDFFNELRILKELDHPNVVKLYEVYSDKDCYYLVMEYLEGGDIVSNLPQTTEEREKRIKKILFQAISALNYTHHNRIVHRDIKPDNMMLCDKSSNSDIKLVDFGFSKKYADDKGLMKSFLGTPFFIAPEVIDQNYTEQCDLWSIGATAYLLFTGHPPFNSQGKSELLKKIKKDEVSYGDEVWKHLSKDAMDLTSKLLVKDPDLRLTAAAALKHGFFKNLYEEVHEKNRFDTDVLKNLLVFRSKEKFKQLVLSMLIKSIPKEQICKLNEVFTAMDFDHQGYINLKELTKSFEIAGIDLTREDIAKIIKRIDFDKDGKLNYSEFLMASISIKDYIDEKQLSSIFSSLDVENRKVIDKENLGIFLARSGRRVMSPNEIEKLFREIGSDSKGIDFESFLKIMKG